VRKVNVGQILQDVGIIDGGVTVRHFDVDQSEAPG
jgi:hypothetical protein